MGEEHTIHTGVVGLDKGLLNFAVLNKKSVALAAVVTKDGAAVEAKVESLSELAGGVTQEADLENSMSAERLPQDSVE